MAPRLTEAEADDLAIQALVAMRVDEFKSDLRARVLALPDEHHYGPAGKNRCVKRADVLALFDGIQ